MKNQKLIEVEFLNSLKKDLSKNSLHFYKSRMRNIPKNYPAIGLSYDSSIYAIIDANQIDSIIELIEKEYKKYAYSLGTLCVLRRYAKFLRQYYSDNSMKITNQ